MMRLFSEAIVLGVAIFMTMGAFKVQAAPPSLTDSKTVSEYLTICAKELSFCRADVSSSAAFADDKGCIPKDLSDGTVADAILAWLRARPGEASKEPYTEMHVAALAIWPCRNP